MVAGKLAQDAPASIEFHRDEGPVSLELWITR